MKLTRKSVGGGLGVVQSGGGEVGPAQLKSLIFWGCFVGGGGLVRMAVKFYLRF
jgi:hypothetical protein